jgi:RsiW-degrading membrane proteinase PrsW (M82 family)
VALLHVNDFWPLVAGRFVSGVAASFLSTCYECWMVSEHNRRNFPPTLLGSTFSAYVFLMGLVAVASGAVAGVAGQLDK